MVEKLSDFALVTLDQLRRGPVESGDLASKCGRNELLKLAMCNYQNERWVLTARGAQVAAKMAFTNWQGRSERAH